MNRFCVTLSLLFVFLSDLYAQDTVKNSESLYYFISVANAYNLAVKGYEKQNPKLLSDAAGLLAQNPIKGKLPAKITNQPDTTIYFSDKKIELSPEKLLDDAIKMATDETTVQQLKKQLQELETGNYKDRGRQYSPYVQEYILKPLTDITLKTTFIEKEIAEVFVVNYNGSALDLKVYDVSGKILASDPDKIVNCYVAFTPLQTSDFKIEIKNKSRQKIQCLLMTN